MILSEEHEKWRAAIAKSEAEKYTKATHRKFLYKFINMRNELSEKWADELLIEKCKTHMLELELANLRKQ